MYPGLNVVRVVAASDPTAMNTDAPRMKQEVPTAAVRSLIVLLGVISPVGARPSPLHLPPHGAHHAGKGAACERITFWSRPCREGITLAGFVPPCDAARGGDEAAAADPRDEEAAPRRDVIARIRSSVPG